MKIPKRVRRVAVLTVAFAAGLWVADAMLRAQPATQPTTTPSTQAMIDANAQPVVERMIAAYASQPVSLEGTLAIDFNVANIVEQRNVKVLGSALSPNQFSHEIEGEVRIVADGTSEHIYDAKQNVYLTTKLQKDSASGSPSENAKAMLREQNPALLAAIAVEPRQAMFVGGDHVTLEPSPVSPSASGKALDVLHSTDGKVVRRYFIERETGMIDRVDVDFSAMLTGSGASEVKRASATITYAKTDHAAPSPESFTFKPPADAVEAPSNELLVAADEAGKKLVGQPAPPFESLDIHGNKVSLAGLKGKVVIVDFWATWCVPCIQALNVLNELQKEYADKGVVVLAVNVEEEPDVVKSFASDRKLENLRFVLNGDGSIAKQYGVKGLPHSFVVGKDGVVLESTMGITGDPKEDYVKKIEAALK